MDLLAVQRALRTQGFDPGPLDGLWGRLTGVAIQAFQRKNGLPIGLLTGETEAAIVSSAPPAVPATGVLWFDEAKRLMGLKEVGGSQSNPEILNWADRLDIAYGSDDIPWCGLFVAHCVAFTLPGEPLPNNPLGARQWLKFGRACQPGLGAVLVFWRENRDGGLGHVGFYAGENATSFKVLAGNQSNSVSLAWISKDRLLGARWPRTAASLGGAPVDATGGASSGGSEE